VNLHLPAAGPEDKLPSIGNGDHALELPGYPKPLFDQQTSQDDLRSKLLNYVGLALKHKYLITVILGIFLLGGVIVTLRTPKIYSASTTIKIDRSVPQVFKSQSTQAESYNDDSAQFYETQYELIRSRALAERVATALDVGQSDFLGNPQPSLLRRLFGRESSTAVPNTDAIAVKRRQDGAVGKIMGGLSVQPVGQSSIVRIAYSGFDPIWAQRISIAVAEQFEKMTLDMRFSASAHAREFLQERLDELKLKLEDSEKQLIQFAQKEGILDTDSKQPQVLAELQTVQNAFSNAVTARLQLEETWRQAQADDGNSLPQVMSDGIVQGARTRIAQLRANYQDKLTVMKPAFPEMVAIQSQINAMERDIRTQIGLIKAAINDQYQAAVANEKALGDKLAELKADALDLRSRSVTYTILMREVDTNRSLYDGLLQQFRALGVASDAQSNNISILDRAQKPGEPDSPSLMNNLMLALLAGAAAAAGAVWLIEVLDDTFKTAEDLEERLGLPALGVIPLYRDPEKKRSAITEILEDPGSPLAESYRSLRTAIQFSTSDGAPRSLLITSARPGEGKSTTAASLAVNFSQLGMSVLLIDADLRNPAMHRVMNLDNSVGLSNYLSGAQSNAPSFTDPASGIVKPTSTPQLSVVTSGPLPPNPAELLAGPKLGVLLTEAAESFDVVVIDAPPVMGLADVPILSTVVDGTVLVVEGAKTRRTVVRDALKRLYFARARVVGGVLNKYNAKHATRSYSYGYGYAYGYGPGYGAAAEKYIYGQRQKRALESRQQNDA
jgi:polysaccharide biosynthesis transport protein